MSLEYVQHLSNNLKRLYFEDPRYKNLRILIKEQCKDKTDGLVFAVRKNEIHIYYRGGRLLKITDKENKGAALKIYTNPNYAGADPNNEIAKWNEYDTSKDAAIWCDNLEKLKGYLTRFYQGKRGNDERLLQHMLELNNRDFNGEVVVIDNEYGVQKIATRFSHLDRKKKDNFGKFTKHELSILAERNLTPDEVLNMTDKELEDFRRDYKLCKVDLVALFKGDDGKYKICLIELKKGNGATGGPSGIKDHMRDFKLFTEVRKNDIVKSVENLIASKTSDKIDTIANYPAGGIELDKENIYISILCYDLSTNKKMENVENDIKQAYDEETKKILPHFYYNPRMEETKGDYTLRKEDLLHKV